MQNHWEIREEGEAMRFSVHVEMHRGRFEIHRNVFCRSETISYSLQIKQNLLCFSEKKYSSTAPVVFLKTKRICENLSAR